MIEPIMRFNAKGVTAEHLRRWMLAGLAVIESVSENPYAYVGMLAGAPR